MTDILIHKSSAYIKEDRDYYCSDIRDKHGMIKPDDNLISVTADSAIFADKVEPDKQVSIYYPFKAKSFHRIYLGISYPLFANNWGASFLRHLMYLIDDEGAVILPVYAERQGVEKNYWSRSSLEVIFQSRQKWWGMSNIWAENDGVMSMRIGKKQPPIKNSTFGKFLDASKNSNGQTIGDGWQIESQRHHKNGIISAIAEQIVINVFGRKKPIKFCDIYGDYLLSCELLMSDYINVKNATQVIKDDFDLNVIKKYLGADFSNNLNVVIDSDVVSKIPSGCDVISCIDILKDESTEEATELLQKSLDALNSGGIVIFRQTDNSKDINNKIISNLKFSKHIQYSSIVATEHKNNVDIAHYSDAIFNELKNENENRSNVFDILYK